MKVKALPSIAALLAVGGLAHAQEAPAAPGDDLPCKPGVIRPRPAVTPPKGPSKEILDREREVAALRRVVDSYRERVDDAVRTAYRREREAVRRKFITRIVPAEESERTRRLEAIAAFRAFLEKRGGSLGAAPEGTAEATFRLAELLFEDATDRQMVALRVWNTENERHRESPKTPEPRPDYREAVAAYRNVVRTYPSFPRRDAALYMIAFCLGEQGEARASRDAFEDLAKSDSEYRAEAWLRVGEYHFDRNEHDDAIDAYRRAAELGAGPYYDKALYKLAWSYYRRGARPDGGRNQASAWAEAANAFAELVEVAPDSPLRAEALQYLAIIYADHGGLPAVKAAVAGKPWADEVIESLASLWFEQGNWADAASTYELAMTARPDHDDAPLWANRRILALGRLGEDTEREVARAREELHRTYGPGSVWQARKAAKPSVVLAADAVSEPALLAAALWRHGEAQWSRAEFDYSYAAGLYDEYLRRYPGRPVAYDIAFYRAECLYFASRFEEAAQAYGTVLEFTTEGQWHAEAAFSRFKAREGLVALRSLEAPPAADAATKPIPDAMRALAQAAEDFTCIAPTDWRVPEALFRDAQIQYAHGRLRAARVRAEAVIAAAPREDFAAHSTTLAVDTWRLEGRVDRAEADARRYAALAPGRTPATVKATREALGRVAAEAGFLVAKSLADGGQHRAAAEKYLAVAAIAPEAGLGALAPRALFAAGESYESAGLAVQAAKAFGELAARHSGDSLSSAAAFRRARNLALALDVETAARAYSSFVIEHPFSDDASAAAWNAALLWDATGRRLEAAAAYERFADGSAANPQEKAAAWVAAGEALFAAGKLSAAARDFELVTSSGDAPDPLRVQALAGLAKVARAQKKAADAHAVHAVDLQVDLAAAGRSTPEAARAAAEAALAAAETVYRTFEAAPVSGRDPAKVQAAVQAKHQLLMRAREAYLAIASLGDPDATTQSLHRIGEGYAALASAVRALPSESIPRESTAAALDQKALAALERNLELASQARLATAWTAKSRRMLARLAPARWPAVRDDAVGMPEHDVWAMPPMLGRSSLLASNAPLGAPAAASDRAAVAQRDGDLDALRAIERELAETAARIPEGAPARDAAVVWNDLGVVRDALADRAGAADAFRAALAADPSLSEAAIGLSAQLARAADAAPAISFARAWLAEHPADAGVRVNLSGALRRKGDAPAALAMAVEALAGDAREGRALRAAVVSALQAKRPALALFAARQGLSSKDAESLLTLGLVLRGDVARPLARETGCAILIEGSQLHPRHARLAHAAGVARLADGDAEGAAALLERASKTSADPDAWAALAAARRALKELPAAMQAANRALELDPTHTGALRTLGLAAWDAGDLAAAEDALTRHTAATATKRDPADPVPGWLAEVRDLRKAAPAPAVPGKEAPTP